MLPYCCRWSSVLMGTLGLCLIVLSFTLLSQLPGEAGGQKETPTVGITPNRNLVNPTAKNVPTEWEVENGKFKNIKWKADLGTHTYGGPVVAHGKVYVGTNNEQPRDPKIKGPKAILMCFNEADGKFLWQNVHDMPPAKIAREAVGDGLCSTPWVDGDRIYYMAPACQLICADANTGKEIWKLDLMKQEKVYPCYIASSSPMVVGDLVFATTCNGADATTGDLVAPDAPSFVAVNKKDGTIKWKSNLPGKNIIEGQWGNPAYADVNGTKQVIFPGGDCWLYSFEPETGKLLWKFHCNPKKDVEEVKKKSNAISNYLVATPVVHNNRAYIGVGLYPGHPTGTKFGHFWCVDLIKATTNASKNKNLDVSPVNDNFDPMDPVNKNSGLGWHYGGELNPRPKFGRTAVFGRTMSTAAVQDGLVYITEEYGFLHCLDAMTGKKYWVHDFKTGIWGSPFWADNKIYCGTDDGDVAIFAHGKEKKEINTIYMEAPIETPVSVANGSLYVMTKTKLYAIGGK